MKRTLLFLLIILAFGFISVGQVATTYVFTQAQGTFEPLTDGTVLWSGVFNNNAAVEVAIPNFLFDGSVYNSIFISENGYVTFGAAPANNNYAPISNTGNYNGAISAFGGNLHQALSGSPEVSYKLSGNKFVVQWKDVRRYFVFGEIISFQIRLDLSESSIAVVYGGEIASGANNVFPQVGLRGPNNTFGVNVNNRTIAIAGGNWINSAPAPANNSTMYFRSTAPGTVPSSGLTYNWVPGTYIPCFTPTNISASNITTNSADFSWTAPSPQPPEGYAWEIRTDGNPGSGVAGLTTSGTTAAGIIQVTVNGLSVASEYVFYIRSHCGVENYSAWSGGTAFVTACIPLSVLPYVEGFETASFPPPCMTNVQLTGSGLWNAVVNGTSPSTPPYAGSKMASYNCFNYSAGASAALVLPQMQLEPGNYKLSFQMYRDDGYNNLSDCVEIFVNNLPQLGGGTLLGTVNRSINLNPQVSDNGWYLYEFEYTISNRESIYFMLVGISDYGNNIFIDDLEVNEIADITLGWNNLHWPPEANIALNEQFTVFAQCWEENVTNMPGPGEGIEVWIGYNDENTNPENWTNWIPAVFNLDVGNNDEFMADLGIPQGLAQGIYYYASRFRYLNGPFTYGGYNQGGGGTWDGADNVSGVLTVTPCGTFDLPFSEGFESVTPPAIPICWDTDIQSSSIYPYIESLTSNSPNSGQQHVILYNSVDASAFIALVSPSVDEPLSDARSLFYAKGSNGQLLEVGTYADGDFNPIETIVLSTTYQLYNVSFANYNGSHNRIAFKHGLGGTFRAIYLDDILLEQLPPPCPAPSAQPSGLVLTSTTYSVTGTFNGSDATAYLVVQHSTANTGSVPVNTVKYRPGDQLGDGTIVYSGSETSFIVDNLNPFTQYYYTVFAYNSSITCNGPTYRTILPLTGSVSTLPAAPVSLTATPQSTYQIGLTGEANALGQNVLVAWNTENVFGTPTGIIGFGSQIPGGGTVHYLGSANEIPNHNNLNAGTQYYYRAWSFVDGVTRVYSSTSANATTSTFFGVPYLQDFNALTSLPTGWGGTFTVISNHGTDGSNGLTFNLYNSPNYKTANVNSPNIVIPVGSLCRLVFDYRIVNYTGYPNVATTLGADDKIEVKYSTDNGSTYNVLYTINQVNHVTSTSFANTLIDLSALNGPVKFQFLATWGEGDYYVDIDNFKVEITPTEPIFFVNPTEKDYGTVSIFAPPVPQVFTIRNNGVGVLEISSILLGGPDPDQFALVDGNDYPIELAEGEQTTVQVNFAPNSDGPKTGFLVINDNLSAKVQRALPLQGIGIDPTITSFPWLESFEQSWPPTGWINNLWDDSKFGAARTGSHWAYSNNNGSTLITPPIQLPDDGLTYTFSAYYRVESATYPQDFDVLLSTDGINFDVVVFEGRGVINTNYLNISLDLDEYAGETIYLRFDGLYGTGGYAYGICIDDVSIFSPLAHTFVATNLSCFESNDGSISVNIQGGTPPYTVTWYGPGFDPDGTTTENPVATGLAVGVYEYTVKDAAQSQQGSEEITLTQPAAVPVPTTNNLTVIYDGLAKTLTAVAPAGTSLLWYNVAEGGTAIVSPTATDAGIYNFWVTALNAELGCESDRVPAILTIQKKNLTVIADNQSKCQNTPLPVLTISYAGFVAGEGIANLTSLPMTSTTALPGSPVGTYPITVSGGTSNNYSFTYQNGTLTVIRTPIISAGDPGFVCVSESFPIVGATASNFGSLLWTSSGNGVFSNSGIVNPVYTPGSQDITNGSVTLTLTGDPGSFCSVSDEVLLTIQNDLPVSVSITQADDEICIDETVVFNAFPVNGGLTPGYQWKVNGVNAGSNNPIFTYVPTNGDVVTVVLTTSISCAINNTAVSNANTLTVIPDLTAQVFITTPSEAVCDFTPTTFTAFGTNGGNNPTYQWKVNGVNVGTDNTVFTYVPLNGDVVEVMMTSSHSCAVVPVANSNTITMSVAPPLLVLVANPENGGTVSGGGSYADGTEVNILAVPEIGWEFLNWKNGNGIVISTDSATTFTISDCYEQLTATFSSKAKIAGQLKYFNDQETLIPSPNENGVFYVQLFHQGVAFSERQMVKHSLEAGLDSYFEFTGVESGKEYTLRVWEEATNNILANTWSWNNWGGASSIDALAINYMTVQSNILSLFPWILPIENNPYTYYFSVVANVNSDVNITSLDALILMNRIVGIAGSSPFPGQTNNFRLATTKLDTHEGMAYPNAPELVLNAVGNYAATTQSPQYYREIELADLSDGLNVFNIYFVASGDMNASYFSESEAKSSESLIYNNIIAAQVGDEILIPVLINQNAEVNAITLGFEYNNQILQVTDVVGYDIYNIDHETGSVRIAWINQLGKVFGQGQEVVVLKAKILADIHAGTRFAELSSATEFGGANAGLLQGIGLSTNYIETGVTGVDELSTLNHSIFPNPFNDYTNIQYSLPNAGKVRVDVYNLFGQLVISLVDEMQKAGTHKLMINNYELNGAGSYFYQINVESERHSFTERGTIVLTK
jgi:hypothetical protein